MTKKQSTECLLLGMGSHGFWEPLSVGSEQACYDAASDYVVYEQFMVVEVRGLGYPPKSRVVWKPASSAYLDSLL